MGTAVANPVLTMRVGRILVKVTSSDIDCGFRNVSSCCPIARALSRMGFKSINVWADRASFLDVQSDEFINRPLPEEARAFVTAFDAKKPVKPITFHI